MSTGFRWMTLGLCLWCGCAGSMALAQQEIGPGKVIFQPRWNALRSQSPMFFEAQLSWPLTSIQEGTLQVEAYRDQTLLERWHSHPTLMSDVGQTLNVAFPYPILTNDSQTYKLQAHFLGNDQSRIYLDEHVLLPYSRWKRVSVVGLIEDRPSTVPSGMVQASENLSEFFTMIALEPWFPAGRGEEENGLLRAWQRRVINIPVVDVPTKPLEFLAFDVVLVSSDQLTKLKPAQREALMQWTLGGGSLAVSVPSTVPPEMEPWFNRLCGGTAIDPTVRISKSGELALLNEPGGTVQRFFPGVGRFALITQPPALESQDWQEVVLHLWKVRSEQQSHVLSRPQGTAFRFSRDDDWTNRDPHFPYPWEPAGDANSGVLTQFLLPGEVKGVPLWLVCSVLAGCFVLVVPGDYFVLGALRLRRWTWVVMPVIALACTWYMVSTANDYMGNQDHTQTLTFVDLDKELRPVRWNQFELAFPAATKTLRRVQHDVLETDLGEGKTDGSVPGTLPDPDRTSFAEFREAVHSLGAPRLAPTDIPNYTGTVPGDYTVTRKANQWTARVSRLISFEPLEGIETDWLPGATPLETTDAPGWLALAEQHFEYAVVVYWNEKQNAVELISEKHLDGLQLLPPRLQTAVNFVKSQTHRHERGMFRIVSELSPQGLYVTEDLALDPQQGMLVILTANEDASQIVAWRMRTNTALVP